MYLGKYMQPFKHMFLILMQSQFQYSYTQKTYAKLNTDLKSGVPKIKVIIQEFVMPVFIYLLLLSLFFFWFIKICCNISLDVTTYDHKIKAYAQAEK